MKHLKCCICGETNEKNFTIAMATRGSGCYCKNCKKEKDKIRYLNKSEEIKKRVEKYRLTNKEKYREIKRKYREKNKEKVAKYQQEYKKKYRNIRNKREQERLKTEPIYAIKKRLRNRILSIIKSNVQYHKLSSSTDLLGCSVKSFKEYFESKFTDGMTWKIFMESDEIHIDHIKPCESFNLSTIEEQKKCFHYTNLQPLWKTTREINGKIYIGNLNKGVNMFSCSECNMVNWSSSSSNKKTYFTGDLCPKCKQNKIMQAITLTPPDSEIQLLDCPYCGGFTISDIDEPKTIS